MRPAADLELDIALSLRHFVEYAAGIDGKSTAVRSIAHKNPDKN